MNRPGHRELKFARTRLAMLDTLLACMAQRSFSSIRVSEVAAGAGVSYATFFNYFKSKEDLVGFAVELWTFEICHELGARRGLQAVDEVFRYTAAQCRKSPAIMAEMAVYESTRGDSSRFEPLTAAEKWLRFPDSESTKAKTDAGFLEIFLRLLKEAVAGGELPRHTDISSLALHLTTVLFGLPASLGRARADLLESIYRSHLSLLWKGMQGAQAGQKAKSKR